MQTTRGARKRVTHSLLLSTARDLFESRGYAATTMDDIATGAGTTRATLYLHFSSKAELLELLLADVDELFASTDDPRLQDVVRSGDPTVMREWLDRKLGQWEEMRSYLAMVRQSDSDPVISSVVERWNDRSIARMRAGLDAAGRFDEASRLIRCTIAFGALESLSRRFINAGGWGDAPRQPVLDTLTLAWSRLLADPKG